MNVKELFQNFVADIRVIYNLSEAEIIAEWIFEDILHIKKSEIIKNPEQTISEDLITILKEKKAEILKHKPIQYVLGKTKFYKLNFKVDKSVLIPRPETEELVQLIIDEHKSHRNSTKILDIGTGSGCIAISLKKNLQLSEVFAIDFSESALEIARTNALENVVTIQFASIDFLDENAWKRLPLFDVIVSNPPYIPLNELQKMDNNVVQYEPHLALFVPDNAPLIFYEKIARFGLNYLRPNGKIFVETHEDYTKKVAALFAATYKNVIIKKDIFEKERMVIAFN